MSGLGIRIETSELGEVPSGSIVLDRDLDAHIKCDDEDYDCGEWHFRRSSDEHVEHEGSNPEEYEPLYLIRDGYTHVVESDTTSDRAGLSISIVRDGTSGKNDTMILRRDPYETSVKRWEIPSNLWQFLEEGMKR